MFKAITPLPENQREHCKNINQNIKASKMKTSFLYIQYITMSDSKEHATSLLPHPPLKELHFPDVF